MSDTFWTSFWAASPALLAALGALLVGLINVLKLRAVHGQINSRMDELLNLTRVSAKAEGVKQGEDNKAKGLH